MSSLCCFWCPVSDFTDRTGADPCPSCGRPYDTPLLQAPLEIRNYLVAEPISRGFYSAAYRARQESLGRVVVLKVVPVAVYQHFGKDWGRECSEHAAIAEGTPFVASITDQFSMDVDFRGSVLPCHVAVLENITGPTLEQVLASPAAHGLTPRMGAQVSADLFEILHLFARRERFHNDLHAGNVIIQRLTPQMTRSGAIDPSTRAVAIDFGSVLDASQSGDHHIGDERNIARHLAALAAAVHKRGGVASDVDYRIAGALRGLAEHLAPAPGAQRIMTVDDALDTIRAAVRAVDEPWRQALSLHRFGDAYNAQALESWHVPELWFDPHDRWLKRTTARGPQVITGMRGCGKTMLLRALHFHARAAQATRGLGDRKGAIAQLAQDDFLGVYASCHKLLNPQDRGLHCEGDASVQAPFERLFVAYLRDAVQVLRHLRSIDAAALLGGIDALLRDALEPLEVDIDLPVTVGEEAFERFLLELQFRLADAGSGCRLRMAPAEAFGHLAAVMRSAAPMLGRKYVLFLLDDVSTRYLDGEMVRQVISKLLFQHPHCAFRITTEAQALQRVLLSPGGEAPADPSRDYEEFDLGNEVYRLLQDGSTRESMGFVSEILKRRGRHFQDDPIYRLDPREVLGDVYLEDIAKEIATSSTSSPSKKRVYRGLRAVQAVCVGDLGDVVKLYEKLLQHADIAALPVPAEKQSACFLEHSASLMHFLNRRDQQKKSLALAFAQAAGELLQRSAKANGGSSAHGLRQYTKLYVRVDAGPHFAEVANSLLALLDAGVFVYDGGTPRTKTRDDDPVLQFKLSYRKMLGLASFIGLADRDRFELSGETLRRWLEQPENAKSILVESVARRASGVEDDAAGSSSATSGKGLGIAGEVSAPAPPPTDHAVPRMALAESRRPGSRVKSSSQLSLTIPPEPTDQQEGGGRPAPALGVTATSCSLESWSEGEVHTLVLALGFEPRTLVSAERFLRVVRPQRTILVRYDGDQGSEVARLVARHSIPSQTVTSIAALAELLMDGSNAVVDVSGLSKPYLFVAVREALARAGRVGVVHTLAEHYYPRNEDLRELGVTGEGDGIVLERLGEVLTGEAGPYELVQVHHAAAEPERWRALLASASPKNDRLLHLLDARTYDAARIFVPRPTTPRRRVARAAAELAASAADANIGRIEVDTNDIEAALREAEAVYAELYFRSGANVEIGLTGSKIHAVAFAALAAAARISAAWYVLPKKIDRQHFTDGAADTHCFELTLR